MRIKKHSVRIVVLLVSAVVVGQFLFQGVPEARAQITLPPIGSVAVIRTSNPWQDASDPRVRTGDPNRMAYSDVIVLEIRGADGKPYPELISGSDSEGILQATPYFVLQLQKGDGSTVRLDPDNPNPDVDPSSYVSVNKAQSRIMLLTKQFGKSSSQVADRFLNPLVPGAVTLQSITPKANVRLYRAGGVVTDAGKVSGPPASLGQRLFTIANPPRLTSLSKTSAAGNETITLGGTNFDTWSATTLANQNTLNFDLVSADTASGVYISRVINSMAIYQEDRVHYCSSTQIKFDMPPDAGIDPSKSASRRWEFSSMPTGSHTVTLVNDFGVSNALTINFVGGEVQPAYDPACANSPGTITSISPLSGPPGTIVTIDGTGFQVGYNLSAGFGSDNAVSIGGVFAEAVDFTFDTSKGTGPNGTQIKIRVPPGAKTGRIAVKPTLKYSIVGPVFTVTAGGGGGGGGGTPLTVSSVAPSSFYIGETNPIIIEGSGFAPDTVVTSDNPLVTFQNLWVKGTGEYLIVEPVVEASAAGTATIFVNSGGTSSSISVDLANRAPNSPQISGVTVNPTTEPGIVKVVMTGSNLEGSTGQILGLRNIIVNSYVVNSASEATFEVEVFSFDVEDAFGFRALFKQAFAETTDRGLIYITGSEGRDTVLLPEESLSFDPADGPPQRGSLTLSATGFERICSKDTGLAVCVQQLYLLSLGLGAIVALLMIVLAGYRYMTAQGNAQQVEKAKEAFASAFIGLIIIFVAFILLYLINPDLVRFKPLPLPPIPSSR